MALFNKLFELVTNPFDEQPNTDRFTEPAPSTFGPFMTFCGT